jgi:hypothetical protein
MTSSLHKLCHRSDKRDKIKKIACLREMEVKCSWRTTCTPSCSLSLPSDATFPWSPGTLCLPGPRAPRAVPNRFLHSFCPGLLRLADRKRARRCSGLGGGAALGLVSLPRFLRAIRGVWGWLEICFDGIRCWGWRKLGETRQGRWLWRIAVRAIG